MQPCFINRSPRRRLIYSAQDSPTANLALRQNPAGLIPRLKIAVTVSQSSAA